MQNKNGRNNKKIRVLTAFLCLGFLIFHFSATFLFTSPLKNHKNENIHYVVNGYIYPLFWQNWSLFVSAPVLSKKIEISFKKSDSEYSEYINPLEEHYAIFNWLRYGPQGKVILGFDNTLWWVYDGLNRLNTPWGRKLEGMEAIRFKKTHAYQQLRQLVTGSFHRQYDGEFQGAIVKFIVEDVEMKETYFLILDIE
jgi:hypothetical protein